MEVGSERPGERETAISALNAAVEAMGFTEKISTITPAWQGCFWLRQRTSYAIRACFLLSCSNLLQVYA